MGGARGNVLLTVQQISFAKLLAANDKRTRDKGLKKLRNYFSSRSEGIQRFTEDDFMRIWKGLYYCMWMSDKPLIQEELAENISSLLHCLKHTGPAILFIKTFFLTMGVEWFGIDQHRLDKFLMLVRRFLRQALVYCQQRDWNTDVVNKMADAFSATVLSVSSASSGSPRQLGLTLHFIDIFLEELAKVSKGKLDENVLLKFLEPFLHYVTDQDEPRARSHITKHIFHHLMKQSDVGIEYEEKFAAWKQAGFPGESCDDMEKVQLEEEEQELSEEEVDSDIKDPRAGKVDVVLPQLCFSAEKVAALVLQHGMRSPIVKSRKMLYELANQFSLMAKGSYPLAFQLKVPEGVLGKRKVRRKKDIWKAAEELLQFEESVKNDDKKEEIGEGETETDDESIANLKRKVSKEDDLSDNVPLKYRKLELKLDRCDLSKEHTKRKMKKQKERKVRLNGDGANKSLVHLRNNSSGGHRVNILKRRIVNNGINVKVPTKEKEKCASRIRLKKLRVQLNRWEVTDISNKPKQVSPAREQERKVQRLSLTSTPGQEERMKARKLLINGISGSTKKVNISLEKNKAQKVSDYLKSVRMSPSVPFDAARRPTQGVLKPSPMTSPIDPFYYNRRSGRNLLNTSNS